MSAPYYPGQLVGKSYCSSLACQPAKTFFFIVHRRFEIVEGVTNIAVGVYEASVGDIVGGADIIGGGCVDIVSATSSDQSTC